MLTSLDPADLSPEDRACAVAAILAGGLIRLSRPAAPSTSPSSDTTENSPESTPNRLADAAEKSVTVSAG